MSSLILSFPEMSNAVSSGRHEYLFNSSSALNFTGCRFTNGWTEKSSDTSRCRRLCRSQSTGTISSVCEALRLYIAKDFNLSLHFRRGVKSLIGVLEISKLSNAGKSSAIISSPCLLNSVLLTFRLCRFLNLDNETTTQNLALFMNVLFATLSTLRFAKVHSPKQPIKSFTVTSFKPTASNSIIL